MACPLAEKRCEPCRGGVPPLAGAELEDLGRQLSDGWQVIEDHHLEKAFRFKNFREAVNFTNTVAGIADAEDHHPEIHLSWGLVRVTIWTHKADGLTENDFILAAKVDAIPHQGTRGRAEDGA